MKKLIFSLFAVLLLIAACNTKEQKNNDTNIETEAVTAEADMVTIELAVEGMTCTGCENTVMAAVNALEGIQESIASHVDSTTVVSFDKSKVDIEKISEAIASKGYTVTGSIAVK